MDALCNSCCTSVSAVDVDEVVHSVWLEFPRVLKRFDVSVQTVRWNILPEPPHVRRPEELPGGQPIVVHVNTR